MAYLFSDFEEKDRIPCLEAEITRLQELCRTNFGIIDELRKENRKLTEVQLELKDTTTDLAFSLAECPWWDEQYTPMAFKILTSFTKNIQYILQLPTFIDPIEQLERYGLDRHGAIRFLKRHKRRLFFKGPIIPRPFKCSKCKKRFQSKSRFQTHIHIHDMKKKLHCRQCRATFTKFADYKAHLKSDKHLDSNPGKSYEFTCETDPNGTMNRKLPQGTATKVTEVDLTEESSVSVVPAGQGQGQGQQKNFPISLDKFQSHVQISVDSVKTYNSNSVYPKEPFTLFDDVVCTFKNDIA